jgi:hypothetical protein
MAHLHENRTDDAQKTRTAFFNDYVYQDIDPVIGWNFDVRRLLGSFYKTQNTWSSQLRHDCVAHRDPLAPVGTGLAGVIHLSSLER